MGLLESILNSDASPLNKIGDKFGLSEQQTAEVVKLFLPALTEGIKKNVSQKGGLESLLGALANGNHDKYLNDANSLDSDNAISDGNGILGHVLKNKEVSKQLAKKTSEITGVDSKILEKMLPLAAGLAMGALKKQGGKSGIVSQLVGSAPAPSALDTVMSLLSGD
ncbi:DUF937 domain-containing protein [candidate division WOR-3 bacterium]|nr:DUF937 domain-containing protein [candidate division WOR-3 bacterium]